MSRILLTLVVAHGIAGLSAARGGQVTTLEQKASPVRLKAMRAAVDTAQKLYEAMEQKLTKAKAYRFDFTLEIMIPDKKDPAKVKGTVILATGNRLKVTGEGDKDKKTITVMVSDGKTVAQLEAGK